MSWQCTVKVPPLYLWWLSGCPQWVSAGRAFWRQQHYEGQANQCVTEFRGCCLIASEPSAGIALTLQWHSQHLLSPHQQPYKHIAVHAALHSQLYFRKRRLPAWWPHTAQWVSSCHCTHDPSTLTNHKNHESSWLSNDGLLDRRLLLVMHMYIGTQSEKHCSIPKQHSH